MPEFFDFFNSSEQHNFSDLKRLPERRALVPMLLLAALIQPSFEDAVKRLVARLGDWCDASIAPVKGYARCLIKLYADYYHLPSPRSQWILDCLRCLLTGPSPVALHAIIAAISEEFGGVVQIKNPFELAEEDQEARCFLLLINITVVFDVGKTIGELATGPAAEQVFADFKLATSHGEPQDRWLSLVEDGIAVLQQPSLKDVPAQLAAELQCTLDAVAEGRALMHYPYDAKRSGGCQALYANFAGSGGAVEEEGESLWWASLRGQMSVVKRFLANGSDVNEADDTGATAMFAAAENNHLDVVGCLLDAGADINKAAADGMTPLYIACECGRVEVVKQLVVAGADVDVPANYDGSSALFAAAQDGRTEIVKILLDAGAAVDAAANDGRTPLYQAAKNGCVEPLKLLLAAGADRSIKKAGDSESETRGWTPLMVATEEEHEEVVALLQNLS